MSNHRTMQERLDGLYDKALKATARAEKAEAENEALEEDMEANEKSLKEYSGFFADLCIKLQERFPKQYAELEGDEYGGDAFGVHELFEHVIDHVIQEAKEQAEAENERLTKMVDWMAKALTGYGDENEEMSAADWKEAARRAVAAGEE